MKTKEIAILFLIILNSLLVSAKVTAKASNKEMQIPNKAWEIIINNDLTAGDNFKMLDNIISKQVYIVQEKDNKNYIIKVSTKDNFRKKIITYFLILSIKDKEITITGKYKTNILTGPPYDDKKLASFRIIKNSGFKWCIRRKAFSTLRSFALLLGSNLKYIAD